MPPPSAARAHQPGPSPAKSDPASFSRSLPQHRAPEAFLNPSQSPPNPPRTPAPTTGILIGAIGAVSLSIAQIIPGHAVPVPAGGLAPLAPPGRWFWGPGGEGAQGGRRGGAHGDGAERASGGRAGGAGGRPRGGLWGQRKGAFMGQGRGKMGRRGVMGTGKGVWGVFMGCQRGIWESRECLWECRGKIGCRGVKGGSGGAGGGSWAGKGVQRGSARAMGWGMGGRGGSRGAELPHHIPARPRRRGSRAGGHSDIRQPRTPHSHRRTPQRCRLEVRGSLRPGKGAHGQGSTPKTPPPKSDNTRQDGRAPGAARVGMWVL